MNLRIDPMLKANGDTALAEIGLTPSQAVRALWGKAAKRGKDLAEVAQLLAAESTPKQNGSDNPVKAGWEAMSTALAALGISESGPLDASDDELLEEFWSDRLQERGLA